MYRISQDISAEPVSTADVKQFIKFSDTDADETSLIEDMIKGARVYIEKQTGLALAKKTIIEYFSQECTKEYVLSLVPVISVTEVVTLDLQEDSETLTLNGDYFLRGLYERIVITGLVASDSQLKVTYTVGYGDAATETLPFDIKQAILRQVKHWYDNRDDFMEGRYINEVGAIIRSYNRKW